MIGHTLEERRHFPYFAILFLLIAAGCSAISFANHEIAWAVFAVLPGAIGIALLIGRHQPFQADVTPDGLALNNGQQVVPFSEMSQVHFVGSRTRCDRGIVHITHGGGVLTIPARLQTATIDVYRFLVGQTPPEYITIVEPQLNEHYVGQVETFGEDKVWVYQARPELSLDPPKWGRYVGPAMLLSAIAWFAAAIQHPVWIVMAVILLVFTPIVWISGYRRPKPRLAQNDNSQLMGFLLFGLIGAVVMSNRQSKNSRELSKACLIVSPAGIALSQGDLHGHMRWSELRNIKIRRGSSFSTPRIEVKIEGAKLNILDIYSSPLPDIHEQIEHYWKAG